MFNPPPFNPAEPCETLAENTSEALRIVRQGEWVYKFLKPAHQVPVAPTDGRQRELHFRVLESHCHAEINPLWLIPEHDCLVSRFVGGRSATNEEAAVVIHHFSRTGRGYIQDCGPANVRIVDGHPVVIDFVIVIANRDWRRRPQWLKRRPREHPSAYFGPSVPVSLRFDSP